MENLEVIRPVTCDGCTGRFSLCFGGYDSPHFVEHCSVQMVGRDESRAVQSGNCSSEEVIRGANRRRVSRDSHSSTYD